MNDEEPLQHSAFSIRRSVDLRGNLERVQERIADAAARAGRPADSVALVAVSKTKPAELVAEAAALGVEAFGENRVQEAEAKIPRVRELLGRDPSWHLVGTLQRNKAKAAVGLFAILEAIDSVRVAEAVSRRAIGRTVPILLEVYLGDDPNRPGFRPARLIEQASAVLSLPNLEVRGLMTVAPLGAAGEEVRAVFRRVRELRDDLRERYPAAAWDELSMGMTEDYAIGIEEGATIIRVGRAIFGDRP
jgi:pyridoxal phosphate enzyme (YggS family)